MMMEVVRTSETSVDNHFTRQYIPEDNSEQEQYKSDVCGILHCAFAPLIFQYQVLFVLLQLTCFMSKLH
jgi:hypothetical protein